MRGRNREGGCEEQQEEEEKRRDACVSLQPPADCLPPLCCVCTAIDTLWVCLNTSKKAQPGRENSAFLRKRVRQSDRERSSGVISSLSHFLSLFHSSACNITSPLCPDCIAPPEPFASPTFCLPLSASPLGSRDLGELGELGELESEKAGD